MVKQVTAWTAEDGSVHLTRREAVEQDINMALEKLGFKYETRERLIRYSDEVIQLLSELRSGPADSAERLAVEPTSESETR
jgi:hypothetical protein